jgi:hypothetical protein
VKIARDLPKKVQLATGPVCHPASPSRQTGYNHRGEESPERLDLNGLVPKLTAYPALVRCDCAAIKGMTAASVPAHSETSTQTKFKAAVCARHRFGGKRSGPHPEKAFMNYFG